MEAAKRFGDGLPLNVPNNTNISNNINNNVIYGGNSGLVGSYKIPKATVPNNNGYIGSFEKSKETVEKVLESNQPNNNKGENNYMYKEDCSIQPMNYHNIIHESNHGKLSLNVNNKNIAFGIDIGGYCITISCYINNICNLLENALSHKSSKSIVEYSSNGRECGDIVPKIVLLCFI